MLQLIEQIKFIREFLWSGPIIVLLLFAGVFLSFKLNWIQFLLLKKAPSSKNLSSSKSAHPKLNITKGDLKPFQAMMTSLAGGIGTGNITGVATAVSIGGFGSIFWMWVFAFLGMAISFCETVLGMHYRYRNSVGKITGGPMQSLDRGVNSPLLAKIFALLAACAVIPIGAMIQSHSVTDAVLSFYEVSRINVGIIIAIIAALVLIGGIKSIGKVASILVPFMAISYLLATFYIILINYNNILPAIATIIKAAFCGQSAVGGFIGSSVILALQTGCQFGGFANEAGMGTLSIANSSSNNPDPVNQGKLTMLGVFISTMIICTATGLVLVLTNSLGFEVNGVAVRGSQLALHAFGSVMYGFRYVVLFGLIFFAFTTILAWSYYGEKSCEYLLGLKAAYAYRWIFIASIIPGAILSLDLVWDLAQIANALMIVPNVISLLLLYKVVKSYINNSVPIRKALNIA